MSASAAVRTQNSLPWPFGVVIIYKSFPKSITVSDDKFLTHVWLTEQFVPRPQLVRIIDATLHLQFVWSSITVCRSYK